MVVKVVVVVVVLVVAVVVIVVVFEVGATKWQRNFVIACELISLTDT